MCCIAVSFIVQSTFLCWFLVPVLLCYLRQWGCHHNNGPSCHNWESSLITNIRKCTCVGLNGSQFRVELLYNLRPVFQWTLCHMALPLSETKLPRRHTHIQTVALHSDNFFFFFCKWMSFDVLLCSCWPAWWPPLCSLLGKTACCESPHSCHHKHDSLNLTGQKHQNWKRHIKTHSYFCCQLLTSVGRFAFCCTHGRKCGVWRSWSGCWVEVQFPTQLLTELFMTGTCLLGRLTQTIWNKSSK